MENDKLSQLEQMLKDGTISKEEYEAKKNEINLNGSKTENASTDKTENKSHRKIIIIIVCVFVGILILCAIIGVVSRNKSTSLPFKSLDEMKEEQQETAERGEFSSYKVYKTFSEDDLAWVIGTSTVDFQDENYFACINRNGETILQFRQYDYNEDKNWIKDVTSFHNGIAIITDGNDKKRVIDTEGNTIIAEGDENCTEILSNATNLGYIIVKKTEDSYLGTRELYGVVDNTGKFVIPLSEENKDPYEKTGLTTIGTGIFRDGSNIVNIATGAVAESGYWYAEDFWEVGDKLVQCNGDYQGDMIVYTSDDLKECARKHFYSIIEVGNFGQGKIFMEYELVDEQTRRGFFNENLEEVIDLSELEITNKPIFKDGYAGLVIRDKWYTVIDENGEMQFEPVEMENDPLCFNLGDKRFYIESNGKGMIIDEKNNVIAQLTTRMKSDNGSYYYSDGYIVGLTNEFINANGEKLTVYMKK